jgi:hypothetical protein
MMTGFASGILFQMGLHDKVLQFAESQTNPQRVQALAQEAFGEGRAGAGGISLHTAASIVPPLQMSSVEGAEIVGDRLYLLYQGRRLTFPKLPPDYLALAIRSIYCGAGKLGGPLLANEPNAVVFKTGREMFGDIVWCKDFLPAPWQGARKGENVEFLLGPAVGVLSLPEPSMMRATYYGPIANTRMGNVLFDTDLMIPVFLGGVDPLTGKLVAAAKMANLTSRLERRARAEVAARKAGDDDERKEDGSAGAVGNDQGKEEWWQQGSWFVWTPDAVVLTVEPDGRALRFADVRMKLVAWSVDEDSLDEHDRALARQVTQQFEVLSDRIPVLKDLKEVAQTVAVVRWLKRNRIGLDPTWAQIYPVKKVPTPQRFRLINVSLLYRDGKPVIEKADTAAKKD